jgi:LmbE family N-acetylglucosaminyl deacetylase
VCADAFPGPLHEPSSMGIQVNAEAAGRVAVVSPHLDDAVLSLGASLAHAARGGIAIEIVTVFAGDPTSTARAQPWDASRGFRLAGEAAAARQAEDRIACGIVGASPIWLPFARHTTRQCEADVAEAIEAAIAAATVVLVPGFPLTHPGHAFCTAVTLKVVPATARVGLYVEQPYAVWEIVGSRSAVSRTAMRMKQLLRTDSARSSQVPASPLDSVEQPLAWEPQSACAEDRRAKRRAIRAYVSQLPGLGRAVISQIGLYEWSWRGEGVAWLPRGVGDQALEGSLGDGT